MPPLSAEEQKRKAAYYAVDTYLKSGMVVGLGTGSSVRYAVERLGEKIKSGELEKIEAIPTSEATKRQAEGLGIRLITLDVRSDIDVAIDGADEVDLGGETASLGLVKGAGGALYREKMVARQAAFFVVIGDESKGQKDGLGRTKLPVEVVPFSLRFVGRSIVALPSFHNVLEVQLRQIESPLGEQKRDLVSPSLSDLDRGTLHHPTERKAANEYSDDPVERKGEEDLVMQRVMRWTENAFVTDNGNYIFDARFKGWIDNPEQVAKELSALEGVVAHGLFLDMCDVFVSVDGNGEISVYESKRKKSKK